MNIYGINGTQGVAPVRQTGAMKKSAAAKPAVNRDEMSVSAVKEAATSANSNSEIRLDLVNRVRAEIAAGTYYSDEKFEVALNRMFASFE